MKKLLELKNISKTFYSEKGLLFSRGAAKEACKNINMNISSGEIVALVGESGSGKTTLSRIAAGLLSPDSGAVFIEGRALERYSPLQRASKIGIVFQNPSDSLNPVLTGGYMIREALRNRKRLDYQNPPPELSSAESIFAEFSLDFKLASSRPGDMSGGQRQRLAAARSFAMFPSCLVLDEVTSSLDVSTAASIIKLLKRINARYGTAMLFITHNLVLAEIISERMFVMKEGEIVESGSTWEVFGSPRHPYVRELKAAGMLSREEAGASRYAGRESA
ncbi:MAG: ABC transporter ATP-binding protein [Elusimicrobia bacterium CG03_land_8_20_14_0_80_50_18]|nr:MAG: ABC transporter ATP-binding protein [Elusimicrobia bacterium CG03_land_8_20_14_0_80_50_18]PIX14134.1 MAG: ABC transporter ATP-binding protein [Elusimicrobia bacterium CG_4_8_14_3_um_filter_50_9]